MPASSAALAKVSRSSNRVASGLPACSTGAHNPTFMRSVDLRLGNSSLAGEEIEIAALISLPNMGAIHGAIAAWIAGRRLLPARAPAVKLLSRNVQMDAARSDIHFDL